MLLLTLLTLTAAELPSRAVEPPSRAAETADTTFPVSPGTRLRLETTQGDIVVRAWDRNQVRVQTTRGRRGDLRVRVSGRVVTVDGSDFLGSDHGDYDITVPAWMALFLENMNGSISVDGVRAPIEASTLTGDITVKGGTESVILEAMSGRVAVSGARGRIELSGTSNHIIATDIQGDLNIEGVSGDVVLRNVDSKSINLETVSGSVYFGGPLQPDGRYVFSVHSGNIYLGIAEGTNATIAIELFSGQVQAGFPLSTTEKGRGRHQSYRFGNGSASFQIESFSGRILFGRPAEFATWLARWDQENKGKEQQQKHEH
jgi:DUF4097 and DUF4098 domain-containing protein YvlB